MESVICNGVVHCAECGAVGARGQIMSMFLNASVEHLNTPCDNKQMTPLHAAMSQGNCNTAAILINAGGNVDALDSDGKTPLHYAAGNGNYKCLMVRGASPCLAPAAVCGSLPHWLSATTG
jgi:ankyrin repeat protein